MGARINGQWRTLYLSLFLITSCKTEKKNLYIQHEQRERENNQKITEESVAQFFSTYFTNITGIKGLPLQKEKTKQNLFD